MIAIEFAMILLFLALAAFIMTKFFIKHSRKRDPLVRDLDTIFYRGSNDVHKKNK